MYQHFYYILRNLHPDALKGFVADTMSAHADAVFVKLLEMAGFKQVTIGGGLTGQLQPNVNEHLLREAT